jgi:hypothetical protein
MYRLLFTSITLILVCLHNLDSTFQYASLQYKILGYTLKELIVVKFPHDFISS